MGAVISTIGGAIFLLFSGAFTAYIASKSDDCKDAKHMGIVSSTAQFLVAIIMLVVSILLF